MFKDKSGLIWIGTSKGISTFNPNTNFLHFKSDPYDYNSLSGDSIYGIHKDDDNLLWMGTSEQGVNIMDGQEIKYLNTENSNLISNKIHDITAEFEDAFLNYNVAGEKIGNFSETLGEIMENIAEIKALAAKIELDLEDEDR